MCAAFYWLDFSLLRFQVRSVCLSAFGFWFCPCSASCTLNVNENARVLHLPRVDKVESSSNKFDLDTHAWCKKKKTEPLECFSRFFYNQTIFQKIGQYIWYI